MKKAVGIIMISLIATQPSHALTLAETIRETVASNPDILTNEKDHLAIKEALKQARAAYYPQAKANLGYGFDQSRNSNTLSNATGPNPIMPKREAGVNINQLIFDGFGTQSDVARNAARVNSSTYKVLSTINDTVQRDVEVYLGVLREQELVILAQKNLAFHEKIHKMIDLRTKSGVSRLADLFQANSRLSLAESNLLAEYSNLGDSRANFFRTAGIPADSLNAPRSPDERFIPSSIEQALNIAIKNNPVIKSANADIYAAIQQHNVAKATNYPRLNLEVGGSRDRNVGGIRGASYDQYAMLRMTYDLYSGGAEISKQHETAYQVQEAKEIKDRAVRQLIESIRLTWDLLTTARKNLPWLKSHEEEAARTVKAYAQQYQLGQRTLLDLLDSQNELFSANRAYVTGQYDLLLAEYRVLRDMGITIIALNVQDNLTDKEFVAATDDIDVNAHHQIAINDTLSITPKAQPKLNASKNEVTKPTAAVSHPAAPTAATTPSKPASSEKQLAEETSKASAAWAVQLGSFKNKENASRLVEKLQAAGYKAFAEKTEPKDNITRVYIGPESLQASAKQLSNQLEKQMHLRGIIVEY